MTVAILATIFLVSLAVSLGRLVEIFVKSWVVWDEGLNGNSETVEELGLSEC